MLIDISREQLDALRFRDYISIEARQLIREAVNEALHVFLCEPEFGATYDALYQVSIFLDCVQYVLDNLIDQFAFGSMDRNCHRGAEISR